MQQALPISEIAKAKVNLDLRITGILGITGILENGYHLLDSIVTFPDLSSNFSDEVTFTLNDQDLSFTLTISGTFGEKLKKDADNSILKAARLLQERLGFKFGGHFHLIKNLPLASGIGGGSADAAAAMRLIARSVKGGILGDIMQGIALKIGADVPVCLCSEDSIMRGIGNEIVKFSVKEPCHLILINPLKPVLTQEVFKVAGRNRKSFSTLRDNFENELTLKRLIQILKLSHNDLEQAACSIVPEINQILSMLRDKKPLAAAMSGSGATCYAIFKTKKEAIKVAMQLKQQHKHLWVAY